MAAALASGVVDPAALDGAGSVAVTAAPGPPTSTVPLAPQPAVNVASARSDAAPSFRRGLMVIHRYVDPLLEAAQTACTTLVAVSNPASSMEASAPGAALASVGPDDGIIIDLTIAERERLAEGLARVTRGQFERVVRLLVGMDDHRGVAELLVTLDRLRAVLRLVQAEIGAEAFTAEDAVLVEAAELLAPLDKGRVGAATIAGLRQRHAAQLRPEVFATAAAVLEQRWRREQERAVEQPADLQRAVHLLRRAQARYAAWPVADDTPATSYGRRAIRHEFRAIEPGLASTYRAARRAWRRAGETRQADDFLAWQREVDHLRHQLRLLAGLWPDVVGGMARSLDRLHAVLLEEHHLTTLMMAVNAEPSLCSEPAERSLLFALAQHRRGELHELSVHAGKRLFAEPTKRFCLRMALYWDAWSTPDDDLLALPS